MMTTAMDYLFDLVQNNYQAALCYFLARGCVMGGIRGIKMARMIYVLKRAERVGFIKP